MKKKLLSLLLVICMLCTLLPMSVLAAPADNAIQLKLVKDGITFPGKEVLRVDFMYKSGTDKPKDQGIYLKADATKLDIFNANTSKAASDTMLNSFSNNKSSALTRNNYKYDHPDEGPLDAEIILYPYKTSGKLYLFWKVTEPTDTPAFADFTHISSIFFGLKDGVTFDQLPKDIIKLGTPGEDKGVTNQTLSIEFTVNGSEPLKYNSENATENNLTVDLDKLFVAGEDVTFAEPAKPGLKGSVTIDNTTPKFGDKLTADTTGLNYNGAATGGTLTYQWYRGTEKIIGADKATYTTVAADVNNPIKVEVMNSNNSSSVFSEKTTAVAKAAGPAAPTGLAEVSTTDTTITVTSNAAWEYSIDGGGKWQDSNVFTGLTANTTYDKIVARVKTTDTHEASAACTAISVTTAKGSADSGLQATLKNSHTPYTDTYDGKVHNAFTADMSSMTGWTATYSSTETGTYSSTMPTVTNVADSGKIYVKFSHNDYADVCIDYIVTVNKADYTFTQTDTASASVGTAKPTTSTENATGVPGETVSGTLTWYTDAACNTEANGNFTTAGTEKLYWKFTPDATAKNYVEAAKTGEVTYTVSDLPAQEVAFANTSETKHFGDGNFINAATNTTTGGGTITYSGNNDTVATVNSTTGEVTIVGVGTVTITATAAEVPTQFAETKVTYELTVSAKEIMPVVTLTPDTYEYDGTDKKPGVTVKTADGDTLDAADYTVEYADNRNAGTAKVTVKPVTGRNYTWTPDAEKNFTITQATHDALADKNISHKYSLSGEQSVDLSGLVPGATSYTLAAATGTTTIISASSVDGSVVKYTLTGTGAAGDTVTLPVTITSTNYADSTVNVKITLTAKDGQAPLTLTGGTTVVYGQTLQLGTSGGSTNGTVTYTVTPGTGNATVDNATGKLTPTKAGDVAVTAKMAGTADYNDVTSIPVTITISKATVTVAAKNQSIYVGGTVPSLTAPVKDKHYTVTGLVGSDTLVGTLAMKYQKAGVDATPTADTTGTYDIVISGVSEPDTTNYNLIVLTKGTLTISNPSSSGGGSSAATPSVSDKAAKELKNAKEGSTVTIDMKGETKLPASVTKEIAGKDVTVELDMGGGMVWSFNGLDVPKGGVSLNLGVKTGTKTIPAKVINALTGETTTIQLQLDHNGPFGMSLKLSVDLGKKHDGLYANLYFYNPKSGELEFQSAGLISGGKASWVFDHASDYAIVIDKESHEPMTFTDVPDTAYYAEAVNWAVAKKITEGVGNDLFAPNDPCTRAQIVTFLWRAAGSPAPKNMSSFTDVPADAFYAKAVAWAVENGITGGTGDGKFSPDATCTRAQSVTFLYRASGSPAVSGNAEFDDVATNAYYADAVAWAAKNGITSGIGGGLFGSDNNCTRAQIVTFLYRSVK